MKAIILNAGQATRLKPETNDTPKCLLDISGMCILGRQLDALTKAGIKDIIIVIGFQGEKIKEFCKKYGDISINFVNSENWETTNNAESLRLALLTMGNNGNLPFLLLNGDVICHPDLIKSVINSEYKNCLTVQRKSTLIEEDMKVHFTPDNKVIRLNKIMLEPNYDDFYYEFTGIAKISCGNIGYLTQQLGYYYKGWFETCFDYLLDKGDITLYVKDVTHYPSMEIDFPADLEKARDLFPWKMGSNLTPDWEFGIRHCSERNLDDAMSLLVDMREVLKKHKIKYWLNWGMLLGAVRDSDFIPYDTDIDVTVHAEDKEKIWDIVKPEMQKLGCFVPQKEICCDGDSWFIRAGEKIELNWVTDMGDNYNYSPGRCDLACPKRYIDTLDTITFRGETFNIPNNAEKYLELSYGDTWRTPLKGKKPVSVLTGDRK